MSKYKYIKKISLFAILILLSFAFGSFVFADVIEQPEEIPTSHKYHIRLDQQTIAKGYTVSAFDNALKLSLMPGILSEATTVEVLKLNEDMEMPWQLDQISNVYQFEFKNKSAYDDNKPFYIQFSYTKPTNNYKQVFFYDKNYRAWRPLPTKDFPDRKFVRSLIHLPFARLAVFSNPQVLTIGKASWYKYKGGNFAASPDFPKGSRLRVYNTDNNKFIDVKINDYGPERNLFPDRVIDLDKIAFSRIASLVAGIINIKVEPLYIAPDNGRVLGIAETGAPDEPYITAKAAIVALEKTNEVIYSKKATSTLPIASLTKLAAIRTFLDTRPSLNRVVTYSVKDEEYNYQYVEHKWEVARLNVSDGDTMTVEDLLYASLVGSANNAIETLARVSGLSRDNFIKKMNNLAAEWGATSTYFVEPTGLAPKNMSSAADYVIITKEALKHPIIQKASVMPMYEFYTINTKKRHRVRNTNKIIKTNKYNITGSKTGYLDEAGYCLMLRAKDKYGQQIIVITLGASSRDASLLETEELLRYGMRIASN